MNTKERAKKLFEKFTGHEARVIGTVDFPAPPEYLVRVGRIVGIAYEATRDSETEKYFHEFRTKSAPILLASPDGKQLFIAGGKYEFTELGIVDK